MYETCDSQTAAIEARHWPLARSEVQPAHCAGAYATAAAVHARHDRRRRTVGRVVMVIAVVVVVFVVVSGSPAAWFFNIAAVWAARAPSTAGPLRDSVLAVPPAGDSALSRATLTCPRLNNPNQGELYD
jgi:hypothetical protein